LPDPGFSGTFSTVRFVDAGPEDAKRLLTHWLSWPVLLLVPPAAVFSALLVWAYPLASALSVVPAALVLAVLLRLERTEPQRWLVHLHALAWGAAVAGIVAGIVNTLVTGLYGDAAAAAVSAPLVEELMKGLGVWWAYRMRLLRSPLDAVVHAGIVGCGFALVENQTYFAEAADSGTLLGEFVSRGLALAFMHPFLTGWTGFAVGLALRFRRRGTLVVGGMAVAASLHALWNVTALDAVSVDPGALQTFTPLFFVTGLVLAVLLIVVHVVRGQRLYRTVLPEVYARYGLDPYDCAVFASWEAARRSRKAAAGYRPEFERLNSAVLRILEQHRHRDRPVDEALRSEFLAARESFRAARSRKQPVQATRLDAPLL
jgi:RsiW-degrading membrane proteinase PrsW (M82 family)